MADMDTDIKKIIKKIKNGENYIIIGDDFLACNLTKVKLNDYIAKELWEFVSKGYIDMNDLSEIHTRVILTAYEEYLEKENIGDDENE